MVMQYTTMLAERRASMLVDSISNFIESAAAVMVKVRPFCNGSLWWPVVCAYASLVQLTASLQKRELVMKSTGD